MVKSIEDIYNTQDQATYLSLQLFSSFYPGFYYLEKSLKEKLFSILRENLSDGWFTNNLTTESLPLFEQEKDYIIRRKPKGFVLTDQGLLVESGLGFWIEFFSRELYAITKGLPIKIFKHLPKQVKRKDIYRKLTQIKDFRNMLVHSRIPPFAGKKDLKYIDEILDTAKNLKDILSWIGDIPALQIIFNNVNNLAFSLKEELRVQGK